MLCRDGMAGFGRLIFVGAGTLLQNGVPVISSLSIVEKTINNVIISSEINNARNKVTDGSSISKPLSKGEVFPTLMIDMLAIGEETGDMPSALMHITRRYDTELDRLVKTCTTVLEPLLIVLVALVVGGIAVCLLLPVLTLTGLPSIFIFFPNDSI